MNDSKPVLEINPSAFYFVATCSDCFGLLMQVEEQWKHYFDTSHRPCNLFPRPYGKIRYAQGKEILK